MKNTKRPVYKSVNTDSQTDGQEVVNSDKKIKPPTPKLTSEMLEATRKVMREIKDREESGSVGSLLESDPELADAMFKAREAVFAKRKANPADPRIRQLESRMAELEGDFKRLVSLLGSQLGDVFKSHAEEIADKYQG